MAPSPTDAPGPLQPSMQRLRSLSLAAIDRNRPTGTGMWAASGVLIAHAPNLTQLRERDDLEQGDLHSDPPFGHRVEASDITVDGTPANHPKEVKGWGTIALNGLKAFWAWFLTPSGFLITIYFLNIVAWGGMLFLLIINATPAMNHPSPDALNSPKKIWLEIDSQILNALFCVTGFGLIPWRFRDLYHLLNYRIFGTKAGIQELARINRSWFRTTPDLELVERVTATGKLAPPTRTWKLDFCVWCMVWNTLFQVALCFFMWHYNRINRPTWGTGLFIGLACGVAMMAGVMAWWEGRKIKIIEGPELPVMKEATHEGFFYRPKPA